jgi:two-component system response regulator HydG
MPFIEIRGGGHDGYFMQIEGDSLVVGRDMVCGLRIDDGRSSRRHCEILRQGTRWKVRDLGSSNGTTVNGHRAQEAELSDGTEIGIGVTVLVFREDAPTGSQRRETPSAEEPRGAQPQVPGSAARMDTLVADRAALIAGTGGGAGGEGAVADLRFLFDLARTCSSARTPDAVLAALGEGLAGRLEPDRLFVFLGPEADQLAWSRALSGAAAPEKVAPSRTVIERAASECLAVLMSGPESDPEFAAARSIEVSRIVTAVAAPVSAGGRTRGVIYADRLGRGAGFTQAELELVAAAGLLVGGSLAGAEELARAREALGGSEILGDSPAMKALRELIARAAPAEAAVLVTGESGTGKELAARAIHAASRRADRPFEVVNCAALAEGLIESELFGHVRGAFTGASAERVGRFEMADGGTLFLDEIGELSAGAQAKLLRVLEQGELSRVGESRVRHVDVRVIAATNRDLEAEVAARRFRQDLYYRLNVLRVELPPLRSRGQDGALLLDCFLAEAAARLGRPVPNLAAETRARLLAYQWPGNVREMRNLVERLAILHPGGEVDVSALPPEVTGQVPASAPGSGSDGSIKLDDLVRRHVLSVLAAAGNNKKKAAEMLGIDRSTLYARLKEYGHEG